MFYLNRNVQTEIFFTHYDMNLATNMKQIYKRLIQKTQNLYSRQFGLVVQIMSSSKGSQIIMERTRVAHQGCYTKIKFSFVSFKPQKDQILSIIVSQINQHFIIGKIGPVQVRILRNILQDKYVENSSEEKQYWMKNDETGQQRVLKTGDILLCKCFQVKIQRNNLLYIIAKMEKPLIKAYFDKISRYQNQ